MTRSAKSARDKYTSKMILVGEYNRPPKSSVTSLHDLDKSISKVHADHPNAALGWRNILLSEVWWRSPALEPSFVRIRLLETALLSIYPNYFKA